MECVGVLDYMTTVCSVLAVSVSLLGMRVAWGWASLSLGGIVKNDKCHIVEFYLLILASSLTLNFISSENLNYGI